MLSSPFAYIISYDLAQPAGSYTPFMEELRRSYKHCHYLTNTWIVLRYETLTDLRAKLIPLIFSTDKLLIMPAKGPADGWMPMDAWQWIRDNVPNEWASYPQGYLANNGMSF
jgi:hypothetical protein